MAFGLSGLLRACALGAIFIQPAAAQQAWLGDWASQKRDEIETISGRPDPHVEFNEPVALELPRRPALPVTAEERARNARTVALYQSAIGANSPSSFLWSGIETANPLTRRELYRWNSIRDQGLFEPERRAQLVDRMQGLGLANLRIGLSNHEIDLDDPASWAEHDAFVADLAAGGLNLSLDMHHFGIEDRFRSTSEAGAPAPRRSYYLHPDWPDYFARFAGEAFRRYGDAIKAVTLVNEPETTVGFNSEMWNGAFPGWGDPRHDVFYVERAFAIASGAVKARLAIEAEAKKTGRRVLYMHTEAAVWKPGMPDFNRVTRFLPSDLILGHRWLAAVDVAFLAEAPLKTLGREARRKDRSRRGSLQWLLDRYVFDSHDEDEQEERRARLVELIGALQALHAELKASYGVAMSDDTVFAADYYAHNEDRGASGARLDPEPQHYGAQALTGERRGLYQLVMDYSDRYGLPMMIGETGTPFYAYGARWHAQMLLECAAAMADGVPMLGYTIYPLVDTHGWETALSVPKSRTKANPGGVLDLDLDARPFMRTLLNSLNNQTAQAKADPAASVQ